MMKVVRGRFTVPSTGQEKSLMFNPTEITDDKAINWGTLNVPGASHPVYQFGSGGERLISFSVYLDGDRGRFDREEQRDGLSVKDHIQFYQARVYPTDYSQGDFASVFPHLMLFTFGELYQQVPVIVKTCSVRVDYWTPKLEPVRATIGLVLAEVPSRSRTQQEIDPFFNLE